MQGDGCSVDGVSHRLLVTARLTSPGLGLSGRRGGLAIPRRRPVSSSARSIANARTLTATGCDVDAQRATSYARSVARCLGYTCAMIVLRLTCSIFWVDVRLREIDGRWIASADTPAGPSLGLGERAIDAIEEALEPFAGIVDELLASLPHGGLG